MMSCVSVPSGLIQGLSMGLNIAMSPALLFDIIEERWAVYVILWFLAEIPSK
jgi:hypothetical protein